MHPSNDELAFETNVIIANNVRDNKANCSSGPWVVSEIPIRQPNMQACEHIVLEPAVEYSPKTTRRRG